MSSVLYCTVPSIGCSTICGRLMPAMFSPSPGSWFSCIHNRPPPAPGLYWMMVSIAGHFFFSTSCWWRADRSDYHPQQAAAGPRLVLDDGLDRRAFLLQHQLLVARRQIGLAPRREGLPVKQVLFGTGLRRRCARQKTRDDCKSETHQSTLAPESFTTFAHLTMSSRRNLSNCSSAMPIGTAPCFAQACFTSGALTTLFISTFNFSRIGRGVAAGAMSPSQMVAS